MMGTRVQSGRAESATQVRKVRQQVRGNQDTNRKDCLVLKQELLVRFAEADFGEPCNLRARSQRKLMGQRQL